ncbi:hypothetical protein BT93_L2527 [Corymbia citriodora subsp. variegata]|uniref:Uncharacterized protein n=1 Tax=Corymbia citriodora subsp. variegata TaxID=360336 RepID=A0A8T0CNS6_CORYI|nr:hypothetical protein BT93_L2527 [Corymbia citriodora subsp. variegata]
MESGSFSILVCDKSNSINEVKFPSELGSSLNLEQCRNDKCLSFPSAPTSSGKSIKFMQLLISNSINNDSPPMKLSSLFNLLHLERVSLSKPEHLEKSGIVLMPSHLTRDRNFKFRALCKNG